jgi:hypothetical protein
MKNARQRVVKGDCGGCHCWLLSLEGSRTASAEEGKPTGPVACRARRRSSLPSVARGPWRVNAAAPTLLVRGTLRPPAAERNSRLSARLGQVQKARGAEDIRAEGLAGLPGEPFNVRRARCQLQLSRFGKAARVGAIVIACPTTNRPVDTGLSMSIKEFEAADLSRIELECPDCGETHVWSKQDSVIVGR